LVKTSSKLFNEDVMGMWEGEVVPGTEVSIVDKMYLEKPVQVKVISGKVCVFDHAKGNEVSGSNR